MRFGPAFALSSSHWPALQQLRLNDQLMLREREPNLLQLIADYLAPTELEEWSDTADLSEEEQEEEEQLDDEEQSDGGGQ